MPGYWMAETSGRARTAVEAYLTGVILTPEHIAVLRAYFRQWLDGPYQGVVELRAQLDSLDSRSAISAWLDDAIEAGIDPL